VRKTSRDQKIKGLIESIKSLEDTFEEQDISEVPNLEDALAEMRAQAMDERCRHEAEVAQLKVRLDAVEQDNQGMEQTSETQRGEDQLIQSLRRDNEQLKHENEQLRAASSAEAIQLELEQVKHDLKDAQEANIKLEKEAQLLDQENEELVEKAVMVETMHNRVRKLEFKLRKEMEALDEVERDKAALEEKAEGFEKIKDMLETRVKTLVLELESSKRDNRQDAD